MRVNIFEKNLSEIEKMNKTDQLVKLGVNKFSFLTTEEREAFLGDEDDQDEGSKASLDSESDLQETYNVDKSGNLIEGRRLL